MAFQTVPLTQIREDPDQPRRSIDDASIAEMAETMKTMGVIEPVILRKDGPVYRLVVGHRRVRAAQLAGLSEIPAMVSDNLSTLETMRMQAIEDAQYEELDPRDRYAFWAKLWGEEQKADPNVTLAKFAKEILGKSETYVKAGIQVAEDAPEALKEMLGRAEDGKLNPTYARYLINDRSLSADEMVAVAKKIVAGQLPASGGRIGTETLRVIRQAPPPVRQRLIHEPDFGLERAQWEIRHHEREQAVTRAREENVLTPGQIAFKLLRAVLDFHTKLDPQIAPYLPDEAWEELQHRFTRLGERIDQFRNARREAVTVERMLDTIDASALRALLEQRDDEDSN